MTTEEAIRILDPETRREAMREIPVFERIEVDQEACRLAVSALRAQQQTNAPLTGWISVKERLPEPGQIVLIHQVYSWQRYEDGAAVTIGRLYPAQSGQKPYWEFQHYNPEFRHGTIMDNDIICPGSEYVTHWMPLPEPPEEADHGN